MRKILLASAGVMVMSAGSVYAACIPTPSCSSLGYESSSSCEGGIKCPFGNAWNCTLTDIKNKVTEITNKVTEIENKITTMEKENALKNCVIGSIFYSDQTCSSGSLTPGKTPIGVVVYTNGEGHGQVMALNSIGNYEWGGYGTDISTLQNFSSVSAASQDLASCENTAKIIAAGDKSSYPAAWAAHEYKTEGTNVGDWCLPAAGILTSIYNNMELVNIGYGLASGSKIGTSSVVWSSSEYDGYDAWGFGFSFDNGVLNYVNFKSNSDEVRPVLEF